MSATAIIPTQPTRLRPPGPMAEPSWRWDRVQYLLQLADARPSESDDTYVRMAYRFMREYTTVLKRAPDAGKSLDVAVLRFWNNNVDMAQVYWVHEQDLYTRFALEALLLTDMSAHELAKLSGLTPAQLLLYQRVFYDIDILKKSRLRMMSWVLRNSPGVMPDSDDVDRAWKLVALTGGSELLKTMLATGNWGAPEMKEQMDAIVSAGTSRLAMMASISMPVNGYTAPKILTTWNEIRETDAHIALSAPPAMESQEKQVAAMLQAMTTAVLDDAVTTGLPNKREERIAVTFQRLLSIRDTCAITKESEGAYATIDG